MEVKHERSARRNREGPSEGSVERNRDPTNRNRIRGSNGWTSGLTVAKSISIMGRDCKSGGCARKDTGLTPGDLHRVRRQSRRTEGTARSPDHGAEVSRGCSRPPRRLKARTVPNEGLKERASSSDVS